MLVTFSLKHWKKKLYNLNTTFLVFAFYNRSRPHLSTEGTSWLWKFQFRNSTKFRGWFQPVPSNFGSSAVRQYECHRICREDCQLLEFLRAMTELWQAGLPQEVCRGTLQLKTSSMENSKSSYKRGHVHSPVTGKILFSSVSQMTRVHTLYPDFLDFSSTLSQAHPV